MSLADKWLDDKPLFEILFVDKDFSKHLSGKHDQSTHGNGDGNVRTSSTHLTQDTATEAQKDAIENYASFDYVVINDYLRGKITAREANSYGVDVEKYVDTLDKVIASSPLTTEEHLVYRGITGSAATQLKQLRVGDEFTHKAYVSTSRSKDVATQFSNNGGVILEINVLPNTRMFEMDKYSNDPDSEKEVLFARGTKMTVTANYRYLIQVDIEPNN